MLTPIDSSSFTHEKSIKNYWPDTWRFIVIDPLSRWIFQD